MTKFIEILLRGWNQWVLKNSLIILFLIPLFAIASLFYTANNLGMNTDTTDMLSPELPWRKLDREYEALFPHTTGNLILVIEAETPDEAMDAASRMENKLRQNQPLFKTIFYPANEEFIRQSSLLYLETDELQEVADTLSRNQAFLALLIQNQSLQGLMDMLSDAISAVDDGEELDLDPMLGQIRASIEANLAGKHFQMSWHELLTGNVKKQDVYREFIIVQPLLDYSQLLPAEEILTTIREWAVESGISSDNNMRLRLTGGVALSHEELQSVSAANIHAIIIAFILVAIVMMIGIGSLRLVFCILVSLLIGLILTAAFATLTIGELNLISVAFAVLYIGLGVDFAIHYCLRYRELRKENLDNIAALESTSFHIGTSLFLCAFTTAIGFYAFVPTDYDGVAELGWISGSGMFISLIITLSFLPALLKQLNIEFKQGLKKPANNSGSLLKFPENNYKLIILSTVIIACASVWYARDVSFDNNTLNLQPPDNESVKTFKDLLASKDSSPLRNVVIANDREEAMKLEKSLSELSLVKEVIWLESFLPEQQDEKLFIIDEMNLLQGNLFSEKSVKTSSLQETKQSIINLGNKLTNSSESTSASYTGLNHVLKLYLQKFESQSETEQNDSVKSLEHSLLASLPGRLELLEDGLSTEGLAIDDLPEHFSSRWKNQDRYLLEILPDENLQDNERLKAYVNQTQTLEPRVTGSPVVSIEAGNAVVSAFKQAFFYAFLAISVLLLLLMPHKIDAFFILITLLLAALMTAAVSSIAGIPLNFANIIALPLLFGIGVDSAIHIIHRSRSSNSADILLASSSARGILVSALTTILSIGNLAFSPHVGTASMGKLLTIGISMALLCTLILIPALLAAKKQN